MKLSEQLKAQGWLHPFEAPEGKDIELLCRDIGVQVVEIGRFDDVEGGFYTYGNQGPVRLDPIAWRPMPPVDWKQIIHIAGSTVAVLVILLMTYFLNQ